MSIVSSIVIKNCLITSHQSKALSYLLSEVEANVKTLETGEFYSEEDLLKPLSTGDRGKMQ